MNIQKVSAGLTQEWPVAFCRSKIASRKFSQVQMHRSVAPFVQSEGRSYMGIRLINSTKGVKTELQRLPQAVSGKTSTASIRPLVDEEEPRDVQKTEPRGPETAFNRITMLEAGRQPGYGKRQQLIAPRGALG